MRQLVLFLLCGLVTALETTPPPADPVAQLALEQTAKHRQFLDWSMIEAFRRHDGPEVWRPDAARWLQDLAKHLASKEADAHLSELRSAGRALLVAGCDDPLVQLRVGILIGGGEGAKLVSDSIAPLRSHPARYPAIHLVSALRRQVEPRSRKLSAEAQRELPSVIVTASTEGLTAPCGRAIAIDNLADWFVPLFEDGGFDEATSARTIEALEAASVDQVLCNILRGQVAIKAAWKARGGGWANTVTEEGWKGFRSGLAEARQRLTAAWQALPESAAAASLMITVAMGDGGNDEQLWFDRALAADPGIDDAWQRISTSLRPRWGGSTQQLLALAQRAVTSARPGNRLATSANQVLYTLLDEDGSEAAAWAEIGRLDHFCPPQPEHSVFRRMGVAWYAGRKPEALALFAQLGGISAPAAALDGAPFGQRRGMRLLGILERARLDQPAPRTRPIPADGTPHRKSLHAPSYLTHLPAWHQQHGQRDPAWDARIATLLKQRAAGTNASASELVAAGCRDPLVRFLAWEETPESARRGRRTELQACWDELETTSLPPVVAWQPAWFLMRELYRDKGATAERAALLPRFAALATRLALSAGKDGIGGGLVLFELGDPPVQDAALLDLIDRVAATPGVEPALASGLSGLTALARVKSKGQNDGARQRLAWTALGRLWPAWTAYRHPRVASAMCTAACIAGLADEGRFWFDEAVRLAYDDGMPWWAMVDGYALTGSPDELIAFATEIAALPLTSGATMRALEPVHSVLRNRWLYNPPRLKRAWAAVDRATLTCLADPTVTANTRTSLLYWRIACAALAEDQPAVAAALKDLGSPYDAKLLPGGIDPAKIEPAVSAALPEPAAPPTDF